MDQEAQIIQAVFPMKEDVMRVFLQRVFAQVVGTREIPSAWQSLSRYLCRYNNIWKRCSRELPFLAHLLSSGC